MSFLQRRQPQTLAGAQGQTSDLQTVTALQISPLNMSRK